MLRRTLPNFGKLAMGASRSRGAIPQLLHPRPMEVKSKFDRKQRAAGYSAGPPAGFFILGDKDMSIEQFAEKYRWRMNDRKHERSFGLTTSEDTIHGRYGEIVADESFGPILAVKFIAVPRNAIMNGALLGRYRKVLAGGLRLKDKYGDSESTFHFDPAKEREFALAIQLEPSTVGRST
jgi:hypothetical protein